LDSGRASSGATLDFVVISDTAIAYALAEIALSSEGTMRYRSEQRIETLADNAVMEDGTLEAKTGR